MTKTRSSNLLSRRSVLRGGAALGGAALASPFYARNAFAATGKVRILGVTTVALP